LGVPERVAVVSWSGQSLGADRPPLGPRAGLERVKQREACGLLKLGVALDLDVGPLPEVVEVGALLAEHALPAGVASLRQRGGHLVADRRQRAAGRPPVGDEL